MGYNKESAKQYFKIRTFIMANTVMDYSMALEFFMNLIINNGNIHCIKMEF